MLGFTKSLFFALAAAASLACAPDGAAPEDGAACRDGDVIRQRHGGTCVCCHAEFGVAGSIDPAGAAILQIVVTDAHGQVATMSPNGFGNFFRHFEMVAPLRVRVVGTDGTTAAMVGDAPSGDCNSCHVPGGTAPPIHGP